MAPEAQSQPVQESHVHGEKGDSPLFGHARTVCQRPPNRPATRQGSTAFARRVPAVDGLHAPATRQERARLAAVSGLPADQYNPHYVGIEADQFQELLIRKRTS
jgi:hypothetical protein